MAETIVVALGGNAIKSSKEAGEFSQQLHHVQESMNQVAAIIEAGYRVVITHGNGPQVGDLLLQQELAKATVPPMPMDVCGAESQGMIGYMIQQSLSNALAAREIRKPVVTILTQVLVEAADPAFQSPSKPVGPFYSEAEADDLKAKGYAMVEDSGRGYRRVVPSPTPHEIIEIGPILQMLLYGAVVICAGGGGVPVLREAGQLGGIEAVIDKDLAGALLADQLDADRLLILTDVAHAAINFRTAEQRDLGRLTSAKARQYVEEGQFAKGSMLPKVQAAIRFAESGRSRISVITRIENALAALDERTGTIIVKSND